MDAICVNRALTRLQKMADALVNSIEEPFPVKGAAFEYDSYPHHFLLLNIVAKNEVNL